jgi:hypothetical protein
LIGFIRKFFPGSRVLILKRDLNNNLLSIFKNDLETFEMKWTYNLKNIVNNYNLFIKYTDHWKKLYPGIVMEVKYEDLIENTEDISKKNYEFFVMFVGRRSVSNIINTILQLLKHSAQIKQTNLYILNPKITF